MKYRKLGTSDLNVSEISLGSWLTYGAGVAKDLAVRCVDRAFELGSTPALAGQRRNADPRPGLRARTADSHLLPLVSAKDRGDLRVQACRDLRRLQCPEQCEPSTRARDPRQLRQANPQAGQRDAVLREQRRASPPRLVPAPALPVRGPRGCRPQTCSGPRHILQSPSDRLGRGRGAKPPSNYRTCIVRLICAAGNRPIARNWRLLGPVIFNGISARRGCYPQPQWSVASGGGRLPRRCSREEMP